MSVQFGPLGVGWRYYHPPGIPIVPSGWELPDYDDSWWSVGQGGFGHNASFPSQQHVNTDWPGPFTDSTMLLRISVDSTWNGAAMKIALEPGRCSADVYWAGTLIHSEPLSLTIGYHSIGTVPALGAGLRTVIAVQAVVSGSPFSSSFVDLEFDLTGRTGAWTVG